MGDTAEDLANLLTLIYNLLAINVRRWDPNTPIAVSQAIRIANKYLVDKLQTYLVQKVQDDWLLTLEDWDRREAEIEVMSNAEYNSGACSPSSYKPLAHAIPEPASANRLALEFACPAILPAAFHQLARTDVTQDWDNPHSYAESADLSARWMLLAAPDVLRLLRGAKQLSEVVQGATIATNETFTAILQPACLPWWEDTAYPEDVRWEVEAVDGRDPESHSCYALLLRIFAAIFREAAPGVRDPLMALKDCKEYEKAFPELATGPTKRLCLTCDGRFKAWVPGAQQELWRKLPEYFEVPSLSP